MRLFTRNTPRSLCRPGRLALPWHMLSPEEIAYVCDKSAETSRARRCKKYKPLLTSYARTDQGI